MWNLQRAPLVSAGGRDTWVSGGNVGRAGGCWERKNEIPPFSALGTQRGVIGRRGKPGGRAPRQERGVMETRKRHLPAVGLKGAGLAQNLLPKGSGAASCRLGVDWVCPVIAPCS